MPLHPAKTRVRWCWAAVLVVLAAVQTARADPAPAARRAADQARADAAWAAFQSLPADYPKTLPEGDREKWWADNFYRRTAPAALKFYTDFPRDPRRWDAVASYASIILNGMNTAAERTQALALVRLLSAAPDAAPAVQQRAEFTVLRFEMTPSENPDLAKADLGALAEELDRYARRFPQSPNLFFAEQLLIDLLAPRDPGSAEARLQGLAASPNARVAAMAQGELRRRASHRQPVDLKFTAVDGRPVDLAQLRGKVVLLDFWATWCVPCKAELPNVKAVYAKYHGRGFEIIGVSLDTANGKQRLLDYCRDQGLTWPQYFDGQDWNSALAKQFAVTAIPAAFLIGKDGTVVDEDARGDRLAALVDRALQN